MIYQLTDFQMSLFGSCVYFSKPEYLISIGNVNDDFILVYFQSYTCHTVTSQWDNVYSRGV